MMPSIEFQALGVETRMTVEQDSVFQLKITILPTASASELGNFVYEQVLDSIQDAVDSTIRELRTVNGDFNIVASPAEHNTYVVTQHIQGFDQRLIMTPDSLEQLFSKLYNLPELFKDSDALKSFITDICRIQLQRERDVGVSGLAQIRRSLERCRREQAKASVSPSVSSVVQHARKSGAAIAESDKQASVATEQDALEAADSPALPNGSPVLRRTGLRSQPRFPQGRSPSRRGPRQR